MAELQLADGLDFLHEYSTTCDPLDCATGLYSVKGRHGYRWLASSSGIVEELKGFAGRDLCVEDAEFVIAVVCGLRLSFVRKGALRQFIA